MAYLTISAAVGVNAPNRPVDVRTVQYLLNKVPVAEGGPQERLEMRSGICGPKTIAAIRRFQQQQLSFSDGRVDPGKKTITRLNEFDARATDKVIITNRGALEAKYGPASLATIDAAVAALVAADLTRGIVTRLVNIDDATEMAAMVSVPGLPWIPANAPAPAAVTDPTDQRQNKAAVDAVYVTFVPDYLMILGSVDIVPHQELVNPVYQAGADDDETVPSDLPYACEAVYSTQISKFTAPTRVVGRLPDLTASTHDGSASPDYLCGLLERAATWQASARTHYTTPFALSAAVWQGSSRLSTDNVFGASATLHVCPPEGPKYADAVIGARSHFVNCHGAPIDPAFYGQPADGSSQFPQAHLASELAGRVTSGTLATAECCYGAELYDPDLEANHQPGFANSYLGEGAHAYMGSSNIAYGPSNGNAQADLMTQWWLANAIDGFSTGRALLDARQRFVAQGNTTPTDLKTLAQFNLMGDPSIHAVMAMRTFEPMDEAKAPALPAGRAERRERARAVGRALKNVPVAEPAPDRALTPEVEEALRSLAERSGRTYQPPLTFVVEGGAVRGGPDELGPTVAYHLMMSGETDPSVPGRVVHVIEAREEGGVVAGYREYSSR